MRILVTEIGSNSSGDEAICIGAAKRLVAMGATVTFCYRVNLEDSLRRAGLQVQGMHMPIEERFDGISTMDKLISAFAERMPESYRTLRSLLLGHDAVMVAPGGKFTEGFNNPRTLLTAALALSLGIPVVILHQSVGPLNDPDHRKLLAEVFALCTLCLIRDDLSMKFLLDLGIPLAKLVRCRDVAMAEDYPPSGNPRYDLGVNIRCGFTGRVNLDALSRFILRYKAINPDNRILVYSTTWDIPQEVVNHLSPLPCEVKITMPSYPDYLKEVGRCSVNVSDSMHGTLFSMIAGRPVICCQTDFRTWKLEGIHEPGQKPVKILPGLISERDVDTVLDSVLAAEHDPAQLLEQQRHIVQYGRGLCEEGWAAVEVALSSRKIRKNILKVHEEDITGRSLRIVAILTTYNEERFIASCLEHLFQHGIEVYLIDNCSNDRTVEIAEQYRGRGLLEIESFPRNGVFRWRSILERKEEIAATLEADWFMHLDADEIHLPYRSDLSLAQAFAEVEKQGYNAVNFMEFTFTPTMESPDHDHDNFQKTMRWYYPFLPSFPHRLNAWKWQPGAVELAWSSGHQVRFPGLRMYPESFRMKHYLFLSVPHVIEKYIERQYDQVEVEAGWHGVRARLRPEMIKLPREAELRTYISDDLLDASNPCIKHYLFGALQQEAV